MFSGECSIRSVSEVTIGFWQISLSPPAVTNRLRHGQALLQEPSSAFPPKRSLSFIQGEREIVFEPDYVGPQSNLGDMGLLLPMLLPWVWLWATVFVGNDGLTGHLGPAGP